MVGDVVHDVVEVVVLGWHGSEVGEGVIECGVDAGRPKASFNRYEAISGSGSVTGESQTIAPLTPLPWRAAVPIVTKPPIECPTTTGGPAMSPAPATAITSSVHRSSEYDAR